MLRPKKDTVASDAYAVAMSTKGVEKMLLYFHNLTKDEVFKKRVMAVREFEDGLPRPMALARNEEWREQYNQMVKQVCDDYKLPGQPWFEVVDHIVQTKEWDVDFAKFGIDTCDLQFSDDSMRPISINISPYATREDIIDFVKTNYKDFLKPLQDVFVEEGVKIGKFRKRKKEEMFDFIFQNQHLTASKIMKLVVTEFGEVYGPDEIRKILQRERKRRNVK